MIYGAYRRVRNAAWQCLIDYQIKALPVKISSIASAAGILIYRDSKVNLLAKRQSGMSFLDSAGTWRLIYNDRELVGRCRFTIAHELGHIFLGHELIDGRLGRTFETVKPKIEVEADAFAARLLSPACVLKELDIHTPEDIKRICDVTYSAAKARAKRMAELYKRNKWYTDPLEVEVFRQFSPWIQEMKGRD